MPIFRRMKVLQFLTSVQRKTWHSCYSDRISQLTKANWKPYVSQQIISLFSWHSRDNHTTNDTQSQRHTLTSHVTMVTHQ